MRFFKWIFDMPNDAADAFFAIFGMKRIQDMTINIEEGDLPLTIIGSHYSRGYPATREDEGEPVHFDDVTVMLGELDITDAIPKRLLERYEGMLLEEVGNAR